MNVGHIAYYRNPIDGEPFYRRALRLNEQLAVQLPDVPGVRLQLASCLISSGRVFERSGSPEQAGPFYQRVLPILVRLTAEPLERPQPVTLKMLLSVTCRYLDSVLTATGHTDELDRVFGDTLLQLESLGPVSSEYAALVQNQWAWSLVTRPNVQSRNPRRAVELARVAVERLPHNARTWRTLGVAQYRTGDWKAAIDALSKSMELRKGGNSFNWFFLAMAHWQLGKKEEARKWYDQAVGWMEKNKGELEQNKQYAEELRRCRAEAAELLGIKEQTTPKEKEGSQAKPARR